MTKILKIKPSERLTIDQILDHPWFKETPLIRELLSVENYDSVSKLKSHMISINPDDDETINDKIKSIIYKKRDSIKSSECNLDTNSISSTSTVKVKNNKIHLITSSKTSSTSK
jgi:serine/threonine protein kinase